MHHFDAPPDPEGQSAQGNRVKARTGATNRRRSRPPSDHTIMPASSSQECEGSSDSFDQWLFQRVSSMQPLDARRVVTRLMRIKTEQLVPLLDIDFEGVCESALSELEGVGERCAKCGQEIQIQEEFAHLGSLSGWMHSRCMFSSTSSHQHAKLETL